MSSHYFRVVSYQKKTFFQSIYWTQSNGLHLLEFWNNYALGNLHGYAFLAMPIKIVSQIFFPGIMDWIVSAS